MLGSLRVRLGLAGLVAVLALGLGAMLSLLAGGALAQRTPLPAAGAARAAARAHHASISRAQRQRLLFAYGRLPLSYEINRGQFGARVAFLAHAGGSSLALTGDGALLAVPRNLPAAHGAGGPGAPALPGGLLGGRDPRALGAVAHRVAYSTLGLSLLGTRPGLWPIGVDRQPGKVNYLIGNVRSRWHTNIPTYARTLYQQAWPGIDVSFSGQQRPLECAFTLRPGADPGRIAVRLRGTRSLRIQRSGDLLARLPGGPVVRELAPHAYQTTSSGQQIAVASRYVLAAHTVVRIALGAYDHSRQLTIDPNVALVYSTYLGGSGFDEGRGIAVDSAGSAYVTGGSTSTNFPTKNPLQATDGGGADAFVTKLNPGGSALVYSTYLGGSGSDVGLGIAVDSAGSAYVTGQTRSTDFPTQNPLQPVNAGGVLDAFVAKLNPGGSAPAYSTYLGGSGLDGGVGIAVDSAGSAYVTGATTSTNFPTQNPLQATNGGGAEDAFVTKLAPFGSSPPHPTSTRVTCMPSSLTLGRSPSASTCTVTVSDTGSATKVTPTGTFSLGHDLAGSFSGPCTLTQVRLGVASCVVSYTPTVAGKHTITASYPGDTLHAGSAGSATLTVGAGGCKGEDEDHDADQPGDSDSDRDRPSVSAQATTTPGRCGGGG